MWCYTFVDSIGVCAIRKAHLDVDVFQPESRVNIRCDFVISFDDVLDVDINEIVKRIDVLLYETLDFEECWQEKPFVLCVCG